MKASLLLLLLALASCAGADHPKLAAGQTALINCAAQDFLGLVGDVTSALMGDDYQQKLAGLGNTDTLRKDAVSCAVKAVNAVVTAKSTTPSTSSASPIALHAAAYLADKHFSPEGK